MQRAEAIYVPQAIVSQKGDHNFIKYSPTFKILSMQNSAENMQENYRSHHNLDVSLH